MHLVQKPYETREQNLERRRIFLRVYSRERNVQDAIKFSNIGVNIKYMKCVYPQEVMARYNQLMSK